MLAPPDAHSGLVFDSSNLLRMQGYLNPASFGEIVEGFRSALERRLRDLDRPDQSAEEVDHIRHDLLNLSGTLGLFELRAAAEGLSTLKGNDRLAVEHATVNVRNSGVRALAALSDYINAPNS